MFHIIESSMGFAGDDLVEIFEAKTAGIAENEKLEELYQQIEANCIVSFITEEEALDWVDENA